MNNQAEVIETSKKYEIRDYMKNLRYTIVLESEEDPLSPSDLSFSISAINNFTSPVEQILVASRPKEGERPIYQYSDAKAIFDDYVRSYQNLVQAMTRDFQDIEIYGRKIDYSLQKPRCCATCHWAKTQKSPFEDFEFGTTGKLECLNPKCCSEYSFTPDIPPDPYQNYSHFLGERAIPEEAELKKKLLRMNPNVDPFGVCKFYEENELHHEPIYNEKLGALIDRRITNDLHPILCSEVSTHVCPIISSAVSSTISNYVKVYTPEIIREETHQ